MKLHDLKPAEGSVKTPLRKGRGTGSGLGKTAGRGHKGQGAGACQAGMRERTLFPGDCRKRGFTNIFAKVYSLVNVSDLEVFEDGTVVTPELLKNTGLVRKLNDGIKVLGDGNLTKKLTVQAHKFSQSAKEKIEASGGKAEVI